MALGITSANNKATFGAKCFYRAQVMFSQSLMATDGTLKLDCASVMIVYPGV